MPPHIFHRIYFDDGDWQTSVLKMAVRAKRIVVLVGEADGLKWEIQQLIDLNLLEKTILLVPARRHDEHRAKLHSQHGLAIPQLESHYKRPFRPRSSDLCPIEFYHATARPVAIIPRPFVVLYPLIAPDYLFRLVMWIIMLIIPWLKRYEWLIDRKRSRHVNYFRTLQPVITRIDPNFPSKIWDRFI